MVGNRLYLFLNVKKVMNRLKTSLTDWGHNDYLGMKKKYIIYCSLFILCLADLFVKTIEKNIWMIIVRFSIFGTVVK